MADSTTGPAVVMNNSNASPLAGPAVDTAGNPTFSSTGQPIATPPVVSSPATPIAADVLGTFAKPYSIPTQTSVPPTAPTAIPPQGTTADTAGNVSVTPPVAGAQPTDTQSWIKSQLQSLGTQLGTQGQVTSDLNASAGIDTKTTDAANAYNNYNQAKLALQQKVADIQKNSSGMTANGVNEMVADAQRTGNADLANLAAISDAAQNNLSAAQKTVNDKITAQFQPIQSQIDFLTKFASVNDNDLTDSQKTQITANVDALKTASSGVQSAASDIHQTLLKSGAPASAYSDVDKITQAYTSGNITAQEAQSQMYAAAAKYSQAGAGTSGSSDYTPGADPVVDSHIANVLNGNETMAQVPANLRNQVSLGLNNQPAASYSPLASSRFTTAASRITSQFTNMAAYQLTANGQVYLDRINAAIQTPGSVSDQDLLDSLTKLNTGGNAISDAQVKIITDGKSFSDTADTLKNKLSTGGVLSDVQRQQINTIAKNIFANYQKSYQPIYNQAAAQLTAAGIPKAFWTIPDLNTLSTNANANLAGSPKGSQSDSQFVESSLTSQGIKYDDVMKNVPSGQKAVLDNKTGQVGYIPSNEFDASIYTSL